MTARATSRHPSSATDTVVGTASGDFNDDGEPDLAVVTSSTLKIELNNGSGGFTAGDSYTITSGYEAKGIVAGNFTGHDNSDLDLAVLLASTSTGAYYVAVYTGDGTGSFATPVISAAGNGDASSAAARLDRRRRLQRRRQDRRRLHHRQRPARRDAGRLRRLDGLGHQPDASRPATWPSESPPLDYNDDGDTDLVVEVNNTNVEEGGHPFVSLDLFDRQRLGRFQRYVDLPDGRAAGLRHARPGRRRLSGLEHGPRGRCPDHQRRRRRQLPRRRSALRLGDLGQRRHPLRRHVLGLLDRRQRRPGRATSWPPTSTAPASPASPWSTATRARSTILLADPASNQFLPLETIDAIVELRGRHARRRPVHGHRRDRHLQRPHQRPVHARSKRKRLVDPYLPRRHRHPVQLVGSGNLRDRRQRQFIHIHLRDQRRGHGRPGHDHRSRRADHDAGI